MYAIVEIAGKQYKVEKDKTVNVDRLTGNPSNQMPKDQNQDIQFNNVLLYADGDAVQVGQPYLKNITVKATILGEKKGQKVRGIKFKKRKNYTRTVGHRTVFTSIKITDVAVV